LYFLNSLTFLNEENISEPENPSDQPSASASALPSPELERIVRFFNRFHFRKKTKSPRRKISWRRLFGSVVYGCNPCCPLHPRNATLPLKLRKPRINEPIQDQ